MTSRAGRHLAYFGFAALIGAGLQSAPAAAQSYLADNSSGSVTVDYSVLGGGMGGVTRSNLPGSPLPSGTCSCANAPMGVIAAAPRPTFNNPFGAGLAMQAPAVPPGFMTYAQATGAPTYSGSSGGAVVLHAPAGGNAPQMAEMAPGPVPSETTNALPPAGPAEPAETPPAATQPSETQPAETQAAALPKSTPTQSQAAATPAAGAGATDSTAAATTGNEIPPAQPEDMPTTVPSPVGPGDTVANVAQAPAASSTENQGTTNTQSTEATTNTQATEAPSATGNTQATEAPAATPPAEPSTEQQAAVTPAAPATEGGNAPANGGGALPAGASRILYTGESDDVPTTANGDLDKIAAEMQADQNKRIQILAYAAGTEDTESKARRKSLARGLAIRSYLIKAGVPSTRIDVRALGSKADGGPADRVDIVPAS